MKKLNNNHLFLALFVIALIWLSNYIISDNSIIGMQTKEFPREIIISEENQCPIFLSTVQNQDRYFNLRENK